MLASSYPEPPTLTPAPAVVAITHVMLRLGAFCASGPIGHTPAAEVWLV